MSDEALNSLAGTLRKEWETLVQVASEIEADEVTKAAAAIAYTAKIGKDSIERRLRAIQYAIANGMTVPVIVELGQEAIVSSHQRSRKQDQVEQSVWLQFKVTGSLRDAMQDEQKRISKRLKFASSEQYVTFLHSLLSGLSDDDLKHLAGDI